jgi:5-amino-6-(5-phosphoribosylamino)uracil reductase
MFSAAISLDGFIDDSSGERLILSSSEDFEDMYAQRAECDAILIGANTVRKDNPSLLFKRPLISARRVMNGLAPELTKVTITRTGDLDPTSKFFATGEERKIVLCPREEADRIRARLGGVAGILPLEELAEVYHCRAKPARHSQFVHRRRNVSVDRIYQH